MIQKTIKGFMARRKV